MESRHTVTLVTCQAQPFLTPSDSLLKLALEKLGASVRVAIWSDSDVDWSASALTVIRSTWDAHLRFGEFESWLTHIRTKTRICNSMENILWNFDKRYLIDLAKRGVATIPTTYFPAGSRVKLDSTAISWPRVVAKPSIGGGSFAVRSFLIPAELAALEDHLNVILGRTGALIQRFEESVSTLSERSLVFIGGEFSHAVRRTAFNTGNTPDTPEFDHRAAESEIAFATQVLEAADSRDLAFARVDILPTAEGLLLMEFELIEPALFLTRLPRAAHKLASTLLRSFSG
jgi:glutathione synthase/RimK-type ligase-like ATP-grasp enzyme